MVTWILQWFVALKVNVEAWNFKYWIKTTTVIVATAPVVVTTAHHAKPYLGKPVEHMDSCDVSTDNDVEYISIGPEKV